jgi:DNA-binding winged helix-turn-helix (wHTH) protein/TolB-like protein/Flp pilus assembly protein TadD
MSDKSQNLREFEGFTVDLEKKILWRGGEIVALSPKAVEVLVVLIENCGEVVSKNDLMERVWGEAFVEESNLTNCVYQVRKTLGELTGAKNLIHTVPRRGYRFGGELSAANEKTDVDLILERHIFEQVLIEDVSDSSVAFAAKTLSQMPAAPPEKFPRRMVFTLAGVLFAATAAVIFLLWFRAEPPKKSLAEIRSIAVLPLKSFAQSGADDQLRLRITDALTTRLGGLPNISIRPASSVLRFAESNSSDALDIGKRLNVDAVLDGSVQTEGDRVRVLLRFVSVADGAQIWAEQFDGKANELLALQDEIAGRLVRKSNFPALKSEISARPTESSEAFELYLKGRYFWNQRTEETLKRSLEFFEQAIAKDPGFTLAHAGLANAFCVLPEYSGYPEAQAYAAAERHAMRALETDEKSAEARTALAFVEFWGRKDAANAERNFRRAIELAPNYATARHWFANVLLAQKRLAEAETEMREAQRLDPISSVINTELGILLYYERKFGEAETELRAALDIDPQTHRARNWLGRVLTQRGNYDAALPEFQKILDGGAAKREGVISEMAVALARNGRRPEAETHLAELLQSKEKVAFNVAIIYAGFGERGKAIEWLKKTELERRSDLAFISLDPIFDDLRSEPEFQTLVSRNG